MKTKVSILIEDILGQRQVFDQKCLRGLWEERIVNKVEKSVCDRAMKVLKWPG